VPMISNPAAPARTSEKGAREIRRSGSEPRGKSTQQTKSNDIAVVRKREQSVMSQAGDEWCGAVFQRMV